MEEVVLMEKSVINSIVNLITEGACYKTPLGNINKFLNMLQTLQSYPQDKVKILEGEPEVKKRKYVKRVKK